jgi:RNA polymerase sigma-70 factor, ECF subfamily
MSILPVREQADREEGWSDEHLVSRVLAGEKPLYEILMRRHNQRLFRVTRAILQNNSEAEDVVQDAYVRAYEKLASFGGRARFSTWLTRIAVHEALARASRQDRLQPLDDHEARANDGAIPFMFAKQDPEHECANRELAIILEQEILNLPENYRLVFVLRDVEEMSTAEAAECLNLSEQNIKVRLHRARAMLRKKLQERAIASLPQSFPFLGARCDRIVAAVLQAIAGRNPETGKK